MTHWETIWEFNTANVRVTCDVTPEDDDPRGHFASGDDEADAETVRMINDGSLDWFCARVRVTKCGVELGTDYLGACCYTNAGEFVTGANRGGYFRDMVREAIAEARKTLNKLCDCEVVS